MDEPENHHSQQTDTRTENQTPCVLTHRWVLNNENMDTGRGASHTGVCWGLLGEGQWGIGSWGGITWGEMPDVGDGGMDAANHITMCVPMQQSCMISTCTPEPKVQLKKEKN